MDAEVNTNCRQFKLVVINLFVELKDITQQKVIRNSLKKKRLVMTV